MYEETPPSRNPFLKTTRGSLAASRVVRLIPLGSVVCGFFADRVNTAEDELLLNLLWRGVGLFDDGLSKTYRVAVELLYR